MTDERYIVPGPEAIRKFLTAQRLSAADAARVAGLNGGPAIRKYYNQTGEPHVMPYAVWFTLHAHKLLDPELVWLIEDQMDSWAGRGKPRNRTNWAVYREPAGVCVWAGHARNDAMALKKAEATGERVYRGEQWVASKIFTLPAHRRKEALNWTPAPQ